jgi:hypothetical protein
VSHEVIVEDYVFAGIWTPPLVASPTNTPWVRAITGAAPPTVKGAAGGMALALTADVQVQNACFYQGDILSYDIDDLIQVDIWAQLSASLAAAVTASFGLASARNDTPESMTALALFKCIGNNNVLVSTDDNVTDLSDKATGDTLSTTLKRFTIDFGSGVHTQSPPALSAGGKAAVQFLMDNGRGQLRNVAPNVRFDMSAYTAGLQLFAQIQKTSDAATGTLTIPRMRVKRRIAA